MTAEASLPTASYPSQIPWPYSVCVLLKGVSQKTAVQLPCHLACPATQHCHTAYSASLTVTQLQSLGQAGTPVLALCRCSWWPVTMAPHTMAWLGPVPQSAVCLLSQLAAPPPPSWTALRLGSNSNLPVLHNSCLPYPFSLCACSHTLHCEAERSHAIIP